MTTHAEHEHVHADDSALIDPVCGMKVKADSPHHAVHAGEDYRFCSAGCRTKFAADTDRYLKPKDTHVEQAPAGSRYTCPMHPQIVRDAPGNCPICGMALEPIMPSLDDGENPELIDFKRRFWWTLPLSILVLAVAMFGHGVSAVSTRGSHLDRTRADGARSAVGRLAVLPALGPVDRESQPQHVDADRDRCGCRVHLQHRCHACARPVSRLVPGPGARGGLF